MALVVLSVVEQRLDAVRAVLARADVIEIAAQVGVHRAMLHRWIARYLTEQLAGLADRSRRPHVSPAEVAEAVEVAVAEMRREHPRWGSRRIRLEMLRRPGPWSNEVLVVPSERTIDRILVRHGLLRSRPRKRPRDSYVRFERPGPMQLWQMDIVGGIQLVNPATGELREAKVVTAVDDHSRYCVIAKVVERPLRGRCVWRWLRRWCGSGCRRRSSLTTASSSPTRPGLMPESHRATVREQLIVRHAPTSPNATSTLSERWPAWITNSTESSASTEASPCDPSIRPAHQSRCSKRFIKWFTRSRNRSTLGVCAP